MVLELKMFKSMVGALSIEYVSSRCRVSVACRGCLGSRHNVSSTRHFWLVYCFRFRQFFLRPHRCAFGLRAAVCLFMVVVISSLTSGLLSESNKYDRATQERRVQGHPIRHAYANQRTANIVIMAEQYLVDSDVEASFFSPFR